ncbi:MAG: sugar nucleotide-binding protein, partial [Treponema sp.]|nr:sugar nucleotide-binding protein [Treponema sp.]
YGIYHVTDLGETTWWDFTNEIKNQGIDAGYLQNKDCVVNSCTTEEYPTPAKRPAYSVLSKDKIQKALGITLPQWQESLAVFLKSDLFDKGRLE